jgi:8-oxo-dGTP pyrophosphatase MutT (NUDIX family)
MRARVAAALEAGAPPPQPRDSATVMLLRTPGEGGGLEVYMLRRRQSMSFAPGAYVYPGGSVDSRDADTQVAWAGPDVTEWAGWLGCTPELARGLLCAAVRETFEESGVLLAGAATGDPAANDLAANDLAANDPAANDPAANDPAVPAAAGLEPDRLALLDRSLSLAGLLARRGLVLRSGLLKPWARWITPELESRRYDTRFFAAVLPEGQRTWEIREEADEVAWLRPADVLTAAGRGEVALMPPTAVTLAELAGCGDVATVLATPREITALRPEIKLEDGQAWLHMPPGLEYPV